MDGTSDSPPAERIASLLEAGDREAAASRVESLQTRPVADRKASLRTLKSLAEDSPRLVGQVAPALGRFLDDENRSVRLSTAKLLVAVATADGECAVPVVDALADRLADETEFYYVRARSAEALGYVARERPAAVASPETLADLRVGLSFDEPEVKEKLAKALECVALGDPSRLRHQVSSLAAHLDDGDELVRYHLCTALVATGCEHPSNLSGASEELADRLDDENPYVRGRAAEALGLLARSGATDEIPDVDGVEPADDEAAPFVAARADFARLARDEHADETGPDGIGTVESIRERTDEVVAEITSPDGDGCPHCGLVLQNDGPPTCPRCGAPI